MTTFRATSATYRHCQGVGSAVRVPFRGIREDLSAGQRAVNVSHGGAEGPAPAAEARRSTARITALVKPSSFSTRPPHAELEYAQCVALRDEAVIA